MANALNLGVFTFLRLGRAIALIEGDELRLAKREAGKITDMGTGSVVADGQCLRWVERGRATV